MFVYVNEKGVGIIAYYSALLWTAPPHRNNKQTHAKRYDTLYILSREINQLVWAFLLITPRCELSRFKQRIIAKRPIKIACLSAYSQKTMQIYITASVLARIIAFKQRLCSSEYIFEQTNQRPQTDDACGRCKLIVMWFLRNSRRGFGSSFADGRRRGRFRERSCPLRRGRSWHTARCNRRRG